MCGGGSLVEPDDAAGTAVWAVGSDSGCHGVCMCNYKLVWQYAMHGIFELSLEGGLPMTGIREWQLWHSADMATPVMGEQIAQRVRTIRSAENAHDQPNRL